jgi:hypothetical protein
VDADSLRITSKGDKERVRKHDDDEEEEEEEEVVVVVVERTERI